MYVCESVRAHCVLLVKEYIRVYLSFSDVSVDFVSIKYNLYEKLEKKN